MFGVNACSSFRDVKDGLSNTVAVAETLRDVWNGEAPAWGYWHWVGMGVDLAYYPNKSQALAAGLNPDQGINWWHCCSWTSYNPDKAIVGRLGDWSTAGSLHSGGCHILLGDGAVRFISENIDAKVRERLAYIADGDPVGEF